MWLRDFLSKDLAQSRVMTYGYDANMRTPGVHTIMDYGRAFTEELSKIRREQNVLALHECRIGSEFAESSAVGHTKAYGLHCALCWWNCTESCKLQMVRFIILDHTLTS